MDSRLLDILCCPLTKLPLRRVSVDEQAALERAIAEGNVTNVGGEVLARAPGAALITTNGQTIYPVEDDIPVMLVDEAIQTSRISDFPQQ